MTRTKLAYRAIRAAYERDGWRDRYELRRAIGQGSAGRALRNHRRWAAIADKCKADLAAFDGAAA